MNEKLRSILRKGDPASGDPGLSPEEVREMRRTVLSAVPEPRRRGWLVPALATAAVLILAAVIALSLWQPEKVEMARGPEPSPPWPPSPTSPLPSLGEGGTGEERAATRERVGAPLSRRGGRGGGRGDGGEGLRQPELPRPEPPEPEPVVVAHQTQIQFSAPGGTRVIWVLNPAAE